MGREKLNLVQASAKLAKLYPAEPSPTDPFEVVLWENIAYLADDEQRREAFEELRRRVGLKPAAIAKAPMGLLFAIAKMGGIHSDLRAERLKEAADIAIKLCNGDVLGALKALPVAKARALVKKFPAIGDPGADRILLLAGIEPMPTLDSNGVRVITRLGFADEQKSYSATYRLAKAAIIEHGKADKDWLVRLDQSLHAHGRALCRRTNPECIACPLEAGCTYAQSRKH